MDSSESEQSGTEEWKYMLIDSQQLVSVIFDFFNKTDSCKKYVSLSKIFLETVLDFEESSLLFDV